MAIEVSDKRPQKVQELIIQNDISVYATGAIKLNIPFLVKNVDFFPASFKLVINGKKIFIDPVKIEMNEIADLILITHNHQDHFSINDILSLSNDKTTIICPKGVYKKIQKKMNLKTLIMIKPSESRDIDGISVTTVPAYNKKNGIFTAHSRAAENIGYIISYGDFKLYHSGDTDYVTEMKGIEKITVAIIPIDGGNLTMSTENAVSFINQLEPKYAIPAHYQIGTSDLNSFKSSINEKTEVRIMDGQRIV